MNSLDYRLRSAITTGLVSGVPSAGGTQNINKAAGTESVPSFREVLSESLATRSKVEFSKHAIKRAVDHNIELTDESLERLNRGVRLAGEKNLDDTLILVDRTAFLVNVKNNMVITALGSGETSENVFTNIDGTVIV